MNHFANAIAASPNISNSPTSNPCMNLDFDKSSAVEGQLEPLVQAPVVALHGLTSPYRGQGLHLQATKALYCQVKEPRPFLIQFRTAVAKIFQDHGLVSATRESVLLRPIAKLMNTDYLSTNTLNNKPTMKGKGWYRSPCFDASDLHTKYQNFPWTTEFPVEELCLTEMGLKDVLRNGKFVKTSTF